MEELCQVWPLLPGISDGFRVDIHRVPDYARPDLRVLCDEELADATPNIDHAFFARSQVRKQVFRSRRVERDANLIEVVSQRRHTANVAASPRRGKRLPNLTAMRRIRLPTTSQSGDRTGPNTPGGPSGVRFQVRVQPRASSDELVGVQGGVLRVRLTAPPVDGAANEALVAFLADQLGVSRRMVRIVSGIGSRNKLIEVDAKALPALDRILSRT